MKQIVFSISIIATLYFILNTSPIFAQSKILINEFLIDPQLQSVEIFNSGTESADISGWIIDDDGSSSGTYPIPQNSIIYPNACLVFSSNFYLNTKTPDVIRLFDNNNLTDSFSYKSSSGSGISYLRLPDGTNNWATASANFGFYNQTNISCLITPSLTLTPSPTFVPIQPTPTDSTDSTDLTDLTNIYLSEAMVNPMTGEKEWVEIYNDNDFPVSLNNWHIDDLENAGSSPKVFSLEINAKGYGIIELTSSIFNNDGDSVRLLDFNKNLKDDFEYLKTEQGKTLGRTTFQSDDFCLQEPSKNSANNPCINPTPTITSILSVTTGRINPAPTILQTKISMITGRETRPLQYLSPVPYTQYMQSSNILGLSTKNNNNLPLINFLCFLSTSYSLLTICSILFRMKLSYGKNKNLYSSSLHPS